MITDGDWFYGHQDKTLLETIMASGWKPELNKGTKYGCGVYLSRDRWYPGSPVLRCRVSLPDAEVVNEFDAQPGWEREGAGRTYKHLVRYLRAKNVVPGSPPTSLGSSKANQDIKKHFMDLGKRAVCFNEHNHEVIVVFDPTTIVIEELLP